MAANVLLMFVVFSCAICFNMSMLLIVLITVNPCGSGDRTFSSSSSIGIKVRITKEERERIRSNHTWFDLQVMDGMLVLEGILLSQIELLSMRLNLGSSSSSHHLGDLTPITFAIQIQSH